MKRLTQKQETFCLKYFELGNATEAAKLAGYSARTARFLAAQTLTKLNVQLRLQELRQKAEDASVASVLERKQVLTEIVRARLPDYTTCGPDRDLINVGPESPNTAALQEIISRTEFDKDGAGAAVVTKIKLHSNIQAISELNKMEHIYDAEGSVTIDNRTLTINVNSEKAKSLTERLIEGERTGGDNDH